MLINKVETAAMKLDMEMAAKTGNQDELDAIFNLDSAVEGTLEEIEVCKFETSKNESAMQIIAMHDPKVKARGGRPAADPQAREQARLNKERYNDFKNKADDARSQQEKLEKRLEKEMEAAKALKKTLHEKANLVAIWKRFYDFLAELKISKTKYFGGTFVGPDLHAIFGTSDRIEKLCNVLAPLDQVCNDGATQTFSRTYRTGTI